MKLVEMLFKNFGGKTAKQSLADSAGLKALHKIQQDGFVSIPADIYVAMLKAGLKSGTEYGDIMHFEVVSTSAFLASVLP